MFITILVSYHRSIIYQYIYKENAVPLNLNYFKITIGMRLRLFHAEFSWMVLGYLVFGFICLFIIPFFDLLLYTLNNEIVFYSLFYLWLL